MWLLPNLDLLGLRLLEESDAPELYALIEENRAELSEWLPRAARQTVDGTRRFISLTRKQLTHEDGFQAAVLSGSEIAGVIGFHGVNWSHGSTSIGYWLGRRHHGRGLATVAVRALVDHALSVWELNRVEIRAASGNTRSRAIPERLGFRKEGVLREAERVGKRYLDSVVYSMLASDWPPDQASAAKPQ